VGLFEMLPIDEHVAERIVAGCDEGEIIRTMQDRNLPRLRDDAVEKLLAGHTSFEEVLAVFQQ
jgi:type II secretory ATPase GspE/PulE/Tfp pilus assembly ATPase PilB-like protein